MKVKTVRASGRPVNNLDKYQEEYRNFYDRVVKKVGLGPMEIPSEEQAVRANKLLDRGQRILEKKYPTTEEWDFIKTKDEWLKKGKEFGGIVVVADAETKNLSYVILDIEV